jgi:uncharacterized protein YeaO (DUF488 family)
MIELQRVYEHHGTHGTRFLVERLWPRGIRKESLHFSDWLKDVAPSDSLRRWFQHEVPKWTEFQRRYRKELDEHPDAWAPIVAAARGGDVVLLYSSHDTEHNNAVVLRDYVNEKLDRPASKPANSTSSHSKHDRGR